jgi:hypothetical protein
MARDRGLVSEKEQLKALIRDAAKGHPTMSEFVRRLRAKGVQVRANIARTGHVSGISYRLDRVAVKGSGLGRAYAFDGLQKEQGVRYDRGRDLPALERATVSELRLSVDRLVHQAEVLATWRAWWTKQVASWVVVLALVLAAGIGLAWRAHRLAQNTHDILQQILENQRKAQAAKAGKRR